MKVKLDPISAVFLLLYAVFMAMCVSGVIAIGIMLAWNACIPAMFNLPVINYWQAFCFMMLISFMRIRIEPPSISKGEN